jgi:hypothetical protein
MKKVLTILLYSFLLLISACGADKLKTTKVTNAVEQNLTGKTCACNSSHEPVCGTDGLEYDNSCISQCFGVTVKEVGHCNCANNSIKVCGADGVDYTECEAKEKKIQIVKFIPCSSVEM